MNDSIINKIHPSKELDVYYLSGLYFRKVVNIYHNNFIYFSFNLAKTQ